MMLTATRFCNRHKRPVFFAALGFCALMIFAVKSLNSNYILRDEVIYLRRIESADRVGLAASKSLSLPLFFGALLEHCGLSARRGIAGLNFLATMLSAVIVFYATQKWLDSFPLGILAMLAIGVFYQSAEFALAVLREPVYFLCVCLTFWGCMDAISSQKSSWRAFACGCFCGLGFWTRFEGIELLFCYPLAIFTGLLFGNFRCGSAGKNFLCFLAGVLTFGIALALLLPDYYLAAFGKICGYLARAMS